MVDLTKRVGFDCDSGNAREDEVRNGVIQREAEQVYGHDALFLADDVPTARSRTGFRRRAAGIGDDCRP